MSFFDRAAGKTSIKANPTGKKAGQYEDEVHYASMELNKRKQYFLKQK